MGPKAAKSEQSVLHFSYLIILSHILWFIAALIWKQLVNDDSKEYFDMAINLGHGLFYSGPPNSAINPFFVSLRTPFYSAYLLLIHTLFGYSVWIPIILQNLVSIFVCIFTLKIFKDFIPSQKIWIYYLFIIFYPVQMIAANLIAPDGFLQLFVVLYGYHFLKFLRTGSGKDLGLSSLWIILAFLTKPIMYPFTLVHLGWSVYQSFRQKSLKLVWIPVLPLLFVFAYGSFMKQQTGIYHISSIQPHNLLTYNVRGFHEFQYGEEIADSLNQADLSRIEQIKDFSLKYKTEEAIAMDTIKKNLWGYATYHIFKSIRYFFEPGKANIDLATGLNSLDHILYAKDQVSFATSWQQSGIKGAFRYLGSYPLLPLLLLVITFNFLRIIGFIVFLFIRKIPLSVRLSILLLITYFAVMTGPVSFETRYFIPILTIMSACAAIGLIAIWEKFRKSKNKTPANC